ncbi:MAG: Ribosome biogenesis protein erb1 [Bogoriella megaspora]|nr:MAG: Ribosome biogenesis protein erb1 [Bogoriella megaspora]
MATPITGRKRKVRTRPDFYPEQSGETAPVFPNGELSASDDESGSSISDFSDLDDGSGAFVESDSDSLVTDPELSGVEEEEIEQLIKAYRTRLSSEESSSDQSDGGLQRVDKVKATHANVNISGSGSKLTAEEDEVPKPHYTVTQDANGNPRYIYRAIEPGYDSDDSDAPANENTIGNIPAHFYEAYPHIGYDIEGKKIMRPAQGEVLDALLDSIDIPEGWTGLTDPSTGKPLELNREELEVLRKLTRNEAPADGYDPYPDMIEYFSGQQEIMPLSAAPEPKRRFVPSKHEAKRVMKMVKAIREGRIKPYKPPEEEEEMDPDVKNYDIWADEAPRTDHVMQMSAPKLPPPGYDESYRPPPEYLPDNAEKLAWESQDPEERDKEYLPKTHDALRRVAGYGNFVKEKFERCLDLYLAPRVRHSKLNIDPESLLPKLPSPEELRPFPTACATILKGHKGRVRSLDVDPSGNWVATGSDDGTVRIWNVDSGYQNWSNKLTSGEPVNVVRWRPIKDSFILAAAAGETVYWIIPFSLIDPDLEKASLEILSAGFGHASKSNGSNPTPKDTPATWSRPPTSLQAQDIYLLTTLPTNHPIKSLTFHRRGAHLSTCTPSTSSSRTSITIHTLSTHTSQHPFRRLRGLPQTTSFHPSLPLFFLVTQRSVRIYDLQHQLLTKTLLPGAKWLSSISVHPLGTHLILGSYDRRVLWHDLDLSAHPYKTLRYHGRAVRSVAFHQSPEMPLLASAGDEGDVHVLHGRVVADGMAEPVIVPLKRLAGHKVEGGLGVLECTWHVREAWCFSAGADGCVRVWT